MSDESEAGPEASVASAVDRGVRLATPPSDKLVTITTNMNTNLTALLSILQVSNIIRMGGALGQPGHNHRGPLLHLFNNKSSPIVSERQLVITPFINAISIKYCERPLLYHGFLSPGPGGGEAALAAGAGAESGAGAGHRHQRQRLPQLQVSQSHESRDKCDMWHYNDRSRPDSFISMESDIASEQDRSEHIEIVEVSERGRAS